MERPHRTYWPTRDWRSTSAQELGANASNLEQMHTYASSLSCIHSIVLIKSGFIVFEEYYQGWHPYRYHNVMSITKTIVASLVGIALRDGYLQSVEQRLLDFFPEYAPATIDPRKQAITLRHLLTMKSGYDQPNASQLFKGTTDFLDESDTVIKILDRPMKHAPGQEYSYDNMNTHLLGHILTRVTGMNLAHFAYTKLFQPLGIWQDENGKPFPWRQNLHLLDQRHPFGLWDEHNDYPWSVDRSGNYIGSFGLQLTPREMAKYGYLYLNEGRWDGQKIIPASYFVETMQHGYIKQFANWHRHPTFFNTGALEQAVAVVPDLDLVAVMTAFCDAHNHLKDVIIDLAIPAFV